MDKKIYDGTLLRILVAGKSILHETDASFSTSRSFSETTSKDTEGTEVVPGDYTWGLSASQLVSADDTDVKHGTDVLMQKYLDKEKIEVQFSTGEVGDFVLSGFVYIESFDLQSTNAETATGSFSFKGSGAISKTTVTA